MKIVASLLCVMVISCCEQPDMSLLPFETEGPVSLPPPGTSVKYGFMVLEVQDIHETEQKTRNLLNELGGFIARREDRGEIEDRGQRIHIVEITLRIEAPYFDAFLARIRGLGKLARERIEARDITALHIGMRARLAALRQEEERLVSLMTSCSANRIELEAELGRVREEIARVATDLHVMENQIAYSILVLRLVVREGEGPSFTDEVLSAFLSSFDSPLTALRNLLFGVVGALPFFVATGIILLIVFQLKRRP